jgi:hypothetical protein
MSKFNLTLFFCLLLGVLNAQSDLSQLLKQMSEQIKPTVTIDKDEVTQQMTWDDKTPWKVSLYIETTTKGKKNTERYEFNLADFNAYLVIRQAKDKYQGVQCKTDRDRKYIAYWENNERDGYTNNFLLYFKDATLADEFTKQIKEAIPLAQTAWNASAQIPETWDALKGYVSAKIGHVGVEKATIKQILESDKTFDDRAKLTKIESGNSEPVTEVFEWSWGDLDPNSIDLKLKGDLVTVGIDARRNLRFVPAMKNGTANGYKKDISFLVNTPDDAKLLIKGLEKLIPLGEKALQNRLPKVTSLEEGIKMLNTHLVPIQQKDERIEQVISGDANMTLTRKELMENDKSKNKELVYDFYLGDLAANTVDLDISSNEASIEAFTLQSTRMVAVKNNGVQANYEKKVAFTAPNIESARAIHALLPQIIALVPTQVVAAETSTWLISALADMPTLKNTTQVTLKQGATSCAWILTVVTTSEKKQEEEIWEFELERVDIADIKFNVSGKNIEVVIPAKLKEKVFKYYDDGKQSFVNSIEIPVDSISKAKKVVKTFQSMGEGCKRN